MKQYKNINPNKNVLCILYIKILCIIIHHIKPTINTVWFRGFTHTDVEYARVILLYFITLHY